MDFLIFHALIVQKKAGYVNAHEIWSAILNLGWWDAKLQMTKYKLNRVPCPCTVF
jgi:hypothetical protein